MEDPNFRADTNELLAHPFCVDQVRVPARVSTLCALTLTVSLTVYVSGSSSCEEEAPLCAPAPTRAVTRCPPWPCSPTSRPLTTWRTTLTPTQTILRTTRMRIIPSSSRRVSATRPGVRGGRRRSPPQGVQTVEIAREAAAARRSGWWPRRTSILTRIHCLIRAYLVCNFMWPCFVLSLACK